MTHYTGVSKVCPRCVGELESGISELFCQQMARNESLAKIVSFGCVKLLFLQGFFHIFSFAFFGFKCWGPKIVHEHISIVDHLIPLWPRVDRPTLSGSHL